MKHNEKNRVVIALGSNHDSQKHIQAAQQILEKTHHVIQWSAFKATQAIGAGVQSPFLNGVVLLETGWDQETLKRWLKTMEDQEGRDRSCESLVTLDLDIVVWNGVVVHPDVSQRPFLKEMIDEVL